MVRTQPRPSRRAGARWDQGPLTSALRQAHPARVVGNKSSVTGLLGDAAVTPQVTQPPHPTFISRDLMTRPAHRHRGRWGPLPVWADWSPDARVGSGSGAADHFCGSDAHPVESSN